MSMSEKEARDRAGKKISQQILPRSGRAEILSGSGPGSRVTQPGPLRITEPFAGLRQEEEDRNVCTPGPRHCRNWPGLWAWAWSAGFQLRPGRFYPGRFQLLLSS